MKCPKCGYNSFEYLDQCKKCGDDLTTVKERCGIKVMLQPPPPSKEETGVAEQEVILEPVLPVAPEPVAIPPTQKPTDLFDLDVFSTPAFGPVASATGATEIAVEEATLPPPAAWNQPEVLGRREEDFLKPDETPLLLEDMIPVEEVTATEEDPPLVIAADGASPLIATPPPEDTPPPAAAT